MTTAAEPFRLLVEASPDGVLVLDAHGRVAFANAAAEQLLGCAPGTLAGRAARVRKGEPAAEEQLEVAALPAVELAVRSAAVVWGGAPALLVTLRPTAAADARSSLLDTVLAHTDNALLALDPDFRVAFFNQRYAELWGLEPEFLAERPGIADLFQRVAERGIYPRERLGELVARRLRDLDAARHRAMVRVETPRSDGVVVEAYATRLPNDGFLLTYRDVTARHRTDRELRAAKDAAERASLAKDEFLASMSHEIRTPMNAVRGLLDLALDTPLEGEQRRFLNLAKASADSLLRVVNDVLDLSRLEAGKLTIERRPFDLRAVVEDTVAALALPADAKGLELVCAVAPEVPGAVFGDPDRIRQVLTNLVGNAVKFTDRGEVAVSVEPLPGEADGSGARRLRFLVRDTGVGIPAGQHEELFRRFHRLGEEHRRREGSGLGLVIARRLVEQMGGTLWVDSAAGHGSTFGFELALAEAAPQPAARLEGVEPGTRVLVAAGCASLGAHLGATLRAWGLEAVVVKSLEDARSAAAEDGFRATLLDERLTADADDAAREGAPGARILLASATREVATGEPADPCLRKPVKTAELRGALELALQEAPREAPTAGTGPAGREPGSGAAGEATGGARLAILLAEDNEVNRILTEALIRKRGWSIASVGNGRAAVEALRGARFDAVLMDVQMPVLDGYEATQLIRAAEAESGERTPIIGLTAHALEADRRRCFASGMDEHIAKPVDPEHLFQTIERVVAGAPAPLPKAPGDAPLDLAELERRLRGNREALDRILASFLAGCPTFESEAQAAIADGDGRRLEFAAHRLKGSLVVFGAATARDLAMELETLGREGRLDPAPEVLGQLRAELARIRAHLKDSGHGTPG